jgi:hypothetical protein
MPRDQRGRDFRHPQRWADPRGGEYSPDRAGADPVAQADQFSMHAAVPPAGILPGKPEDKVT